MSRRFGRNQRRRAREALADSDKKIVQLQSGMMMDRALLSHQSEKIRKAEEFAREIADIVGRFSIIAGEPVRMAGVCFDRMQIYAKESQSYASYNSFDFSPTEFLRSETLRLLKIKAVSGIFKSKMHVMVTLADKTVGYCLTESALHGMSAEWIERRIAPEIARQLAQYLKLAYKEMK